MSVEFFFTQQAQLAQLQNGKLVSNDSGRSDLGVPNFANLILTDLSGESTASGNGDNAGGEETPLGKIKASQILGGNVLRASSSQNPLQASAPVMGEKLKLEIAQLVANNDAIKQQVTDFAESTELGGEAALFHAMQLNQLVADNEIKPATSVVGDTLLVTSADEAKPGRAQLFGILEIPLEQTPLAQNIFAQSADILITPPAGEAILDGGETVGLSDLAQLIETIELGLQKDIAQGPQQALDIDQFATQLNALVTGAGSQTLQSIQGSKPGNGASMVSPEQVALTSSAPTPPPTTTGGIRPPIMPGSTPTPGADAAISPGVFDGEGEMGVNPDVEAPPQQGPRALNQSTFDTPATAGTQSGASHTPSPHILPALPPTVPGSFFVPAEFEQALNLDALPSALSTPIGSLTSLITQSTGAAQAHPGIQFLAMNLQKAAGLGNEHTFTIRMDPPELGRVQIEMRFNAENKLKAIITSEKPETHMMLQRDVQALERLLGDVGIDADNGFSFELSDNGFDFDQDGKGGNGADQALNGDAQGEDEAEIIETTMNWQIDPESGHMRYNILA